MSNNIFSPSYRHQHEPSPVFLNVSKKILARESIFRNIDCNISHQLKHQNSSFINQQQIKTSFIYEKLLQRIEKIKLKKQQQLRLYHEQMKNMQNQLCSTKKQIQDGKVEMWELKNQLIQLEEIFNEEIDQYNSLVINIRQNEQNYDENQNQNQNQDQDEDQYVNNNENENNENQEGLKDKQNQLSYRQNEQRCQSAGQQSDSKPSCSIKYHMSKRSITPSENSSKIIQEGQEMKIFDTNLNQDQDQNYEEKQNQFSYDDQNQNQKYSQLYIRQIQSRENQNNYYGFGQKIEKDRNFYKKNFDRKQ